MPVTKYQLVVHAGPDPNAVYELTQPVILIGRDPGNDIAINDLEVSRRHARLTVQPGGYILEDLGSTNGTFVSGQRLIGPHLLRPGEQIALGEKILLSFEALPGDDLGATMATPGSQPAYQTPAPRYQEPSESPPAYSAAQTYVSPAKQPPAPTYQPPATPSQAQAAQRETTYYSGQVPENPPSQLALEPPKKGSRTLLILGLGCLVVFLCVCIGSALIFDTLNLYCFPPFNQLFNWLYSCPGV